MIDLDALCRQTISVRMGGRCLKMRTPSVELVQRLLALSDADDRLLERQLTLAAEMLSRNEENIAVTGDMLGKYPTAAVQAILSAAFGVVEQAANDPNCASPC